MRVCFKPIAADSTSLPTTIDVREATVGPLFGTRPVSGWTISIESKSRPSVSAAICEKIVFVPWPISVLAASIFTLPSAVASADTTDCKKTSPEPVKPAPCMKVAKPMPRFFAKRPFVAEFSFANCSHLAWYSLSCNARVSKWSMSTRSRMTWLVAVVSPSWMKLRRRNSSGVSPTACATLSMCRSSAKMLCGAPKPLNAPCGGTFVATARL